MLKLCTVLIILTTLVLTCGCGLSQYPPIKKDLFAWQIQKQNVDKVKNTILKEGYLRITDENYRYEGAIVTQYEKDIIFSQVNNKINILLSFKEDYSNQDNYRNLGVTIASFNSNYLPETMNEVDRMEEILFSKLIELCGEKNIERGKRKSKSPGFKLQFGPK